MPSCRVRLCERRVRLTRRKKASLETADCLRFPPVPVDLAAESSRWLDFIQVPKTLRLQGVSEHTQYQGSTKILRQQPADEAAPPSLQSDRIQLMEF